MSNYEMIYKKIKANWDAVSKPLDSMGKLEEYICKLGAIQGSENPRAAKSAVLVLCSDNGIVEEGISQSPQAITRICANSIAAGVTTVGTMAKCSDTDVIAINLGIAAEDGSDEKLQAARSELCPNQYKEENTSIPLTLGKLNHLSLRQGTRNFLKEKAMTEEEVKAAITIGKNLVKSCKEMGYEILCIGEMGIGNTTTSAAIACAMLKCPASAVTGRGAGLDDSRLAKKTRLVQEGVDRYQLYEKDPLTILSSVGGYDLAGMVGVYLGAREYGMPVVLDGAISMVAAMVAEGIDPEVTKYLLPSHKSREPLVVRVSQALDLEPIIDAGMALGEGTGAVLMMGVIHTALKVYEDSVPFGDSGVEQYVRY